MCAQKDEAATKIDRLIKAMERLADQIERSMLVAPPIREASSSGPES